MSAKQSVTAAEKHLLKNILQMVETFRSVQETMPAQYMKSFLLIALDEGLTVGEYARRAGIKQSLMTRHILDMGEKNRHREEGWKLVDQELNPDDRREKFIHLTPKGRGIVGQLIRAMDKK